MRLRASATALIVSFSLPVLLTEAGLVNSPIAEPVSFAQGGDAVTEVARQRYEEGVKAFEAGRFEDARNAFLQVYALKRHPAVLLNLGLSEVRSNYPVEGGNHLQQFLRENASTTPDQRATAEKYIGEAKKRAGVILPIVDVMGAEIAVDGKVVGKSPMLDPVFVKPGRYTVSATQGGKTASVQVEAKTGTLTPAGVSMTHATAGPPPAPTPPPAAPPTPPPASPTPPPVAAAPPPTPPPTSAPAASNPPPISPLDPSLSGMGTTDTMTPEPPPPDTSGKEPFFNWYKRKPIAWVGTGVTGVGLILGITGSSLMASAAATYDNHAAQVRDFGKSKAAELRQVGTPAALAEAEVHENGPWCGSETAGGSDLANYETACTTLREDKARIDKKVDDALAIGGWVGFGVGALGTAAYVIVDWYLPNSKKKKSGDAQGTAVMVAPIVTPTYKGLGVAGVF